MANSENQNDFSKGSVIGNILSLALPMTVAQLINILYNVVDRMYIDASRKTPPSPSRDWACACPSSPP